MSDADFTVFLVDDDRGVLKALSRLLRAAAYETRTFASPRDFLAKHDPSVPGCAVFDVGMPEVDGLQLQHALAEGGLDKPVSGDDLLAAVQRARQAETRARETRSERTAIEASLAKLTPREREVLTHVVAGRLNKQIAGDLGTVEKTIKVHRARMMSKLGVRTVQDLVRLAERVDIRPPGGIGQPKTS